MEAKTGKLRILLICVVLSVITLIAFEQVRRNEFVKYDDPKYVTNNQHVQSGINRESVIWAFTTVSHTGNWHPLTWLSHMLDCELFGLDPTGHHLTNVLFHIVNTLLLFWILTSITGAVWPSAFVAVVFAVHPLHVESVAWVSERKDVLSGLFFLLTIAAYVRYARHPGIGRDLLVFLALALGLMAKPMLVTLPFVLLLLDYWPLGRLQLAWQNQCQDVNAQQIEPEVRQFSIGCLIVEKIPLFVLILISSVITSIAQHAGGNMAPMADFSLKLRISNAVVSYVAYIGKIFYPSKLAVLYPIAREGFAAWQPVVSVVILVAVSVLIIYKARQWPAVVVGWLWYVGMLIPVIGLVQIGEQAMADRYMYLPSIGIFIIIGWGAAGVLKKWRYREIAMCVSAGLIVLGMMICTRIQVRYWKDSLTLFGRTVEVTENNFTAHNNYGASLFESGRYGEAVEQFRKALEIVPAVPTIRRNISLALQKQGKTEEAMEHSNKVILAFLQRQKFDEAIEECKKVLAIKPDYAPAYLNMGLAYAQQDKYEQAVKNFNAAIQLTPKDLTANMWLARTLYKQGKAKSAVERFYKILEDHPNQVAVLTGLSLILATTKDADVRNPAAAVTMAEKANQLSGSKHPMVLDMLSKIYAAAGKFDKAIETTQKAIGIMESMGQKSGAQEMRKRLKMYQAAQSYRKSPQKPPGPVNN